MPRRVQPCSLLDMCIARSALLVLDACRAVETKYRHDNKVEGAQTYLLSYARPLYDRVCQSVDRSQLSPYGNSVFLSLAVHDRVQTLELGVDGFDRIFEQTVLSMVTDKMANLVELDARSVDLTDKVFRAICDTCHKLEKITFVHNSRCSKLTSLSKLLLCKELRYVDIEFRGWKREWCKPCPYIAILITKLPRLETFREWNFDIEHLVKILHSTTQLRELELEWMNAEQLAKIISFCPHVRSVSASMEYDCQVREERGLVKVLAESSLRLETIFFSLLRFGNDMVRLLELKGWNIKRLKLADYQGRPITLEDICEIGSNCPLLEELGISELADGTGEVSEPRRWASRMFPAPPSFRHLTVLELEAEGSWDSKVLLHVVKLSARLTRVKAVNMRAPGRDLLSAMLDAGGLTELESLMLSGGHFAYPPVTHVDVATLERLLRSCPRLCDIELRIPLMRETRLYIDRLKLRVKRENLELNICVSEYSLNF